MLHKLIRQTQALRASALQQQQQEEEEEDEDGGDHVSCLQEELDSLFAADRAVGASAVVEEEAEETRRLNALQRNRARVARFAGGSATEGHQGARMKRKPNVPCSVRGRARSAGGPTRRGRGDVLFTYPFVDSTGTVGDAIQSGGGAKFGQSPPGGYMAGSETIVTAPFADRKRRTLRAFDELRKGPGRLDMTMVPALLDNLGLVRLLPRKLRDKLGDDHNLKQGVLSEHEVVGLVERLCEIVREGQRAQRHKHGHGHHHQHHRHRDSRPRGRNGGSSPHRRRARSNSPPTSTRRSRSQPQRPSYPAWGLDDYDMLDSCDDDEEGYFEDAGSSLNNWSGGSLLSRELRGGSSPPRHQHHRRPGTRQRQRHRQRPTHSYPQPQILREEDPSMPTGVYVPPTAAATGRVRQEWLQQPRRDLHHAREQRPSPRRRRQGPADPAGQGMGGALRVGGSAYGHVQSKIKAQVARDRARWRDAQRNQGAGAARASGDGGAEGNPGTMNIVQGFLDGAAASQYLGDTRSAAPVGEAAGNAGRPDESGASDSAAVAATISKSLESPSPAPPSAHAASRLPMPASIAAAMTGDVY